MSEYNDLAAILKSVYVSGYEAGHNDTVESSYTDAGEKFDDYHADGEWSEILALVEPVIRAKVEQEYEPVVKALKLLVETKEHKDQHGKGGIYPRMRETAWSRAKEAYNKLRK